MKILRILVVIVVVIAAIFFIGAMFLPNSYTISRSQLINAPDSVVYNNVTNFNNFLKWNPWSRMEPSASVEVTGTAGKPGHLYKWQGEKLGQGFMQIKEVQPYSATDFLLVFEEPFRSEAQCHFDFEETSGGTKVTWSMSGESNSAMDKWMYLNMDNMMDKDFVSGLKNLKELSEKN